MTKNEIMDNARAINKLIEIYQAEGEKMLFGTEDSELMSAIDCAICALEEAEQTRIRETATESLTIYDLSKISKDEAKQIAVKAAEAERIVAILWICF